MKKTKNRSTCQSATLPRPVFSAGKIPLCVGLAVLIAPAMIQAADLDSATTNTSSAKSATHSFNIAKQPLYAALNTLAEQAGVQFVFTEEMVKGLSSPGVRGQLSIEEALTQTLKGTGLGYQISNGNTVTLETKPVEVPSGNAAPSALPAVKVLGKAVYDSNDPYNTDYNRSNATTATKTDTPIMETPVSVQVLPQQVLKDQQVVRLNRAVENVSGVYRGSFGGDLGVDHFIIRGFQSDNIYRNGVPYESSSFISNEESANIERVEVLKGPASILYGRAEPGGIVNMVTKQPLATPYYSLGQQFGSFDYYRTTADATGPINNDKSLLYRFNAAFETRESFRQYSDGESIFLAPTFRWNISDQTQANLEFQYRHNSDPFTYGWPAIGKKPVYLPRETNLSGPFASDLVSESYVVDFNWSHAFNENWTLRHQFNMQRSDADHNALVYSTGLEADNQTLNRDVYATKDALSERFYNTVNLTGKFDTWGLGHTLLLGGDYLNYNLAGKGFGAPFTSINILNPVDNVPPGPFDPAYSYEYDNHTDWYGFYLQDQIRLPYNFHFMGGVRYDNVVSKDATSGTETESADSATPRVGLLWQPIPELSFYSNYMENFGAQSSGSTRTGGTLPPQSAQQWELGIKTELFDGRLTGSLAYYDLTKQNVAVPDPLDPSGFSSIAVGEVNNSGVELDVSGEIVPGWNVIGSYSYIESQITKDVALEYDVDGNVTGSNTGNTGNRLANVPHHGGSLWTTYEFLTGNLQGFKFGTGMSARSERQGDNAGSFQLPGYATLNMLASYQWKVGKSRITTQFNVDNLLDKYYFGSAGFDHLRVNVGSPRTFMGSIKVEF